MKRVLFTVYIELDDDEIASDSQHYSWDDPAISKSQRTRIELRRNYHQLRSRQLAYATACGADYFVLGCDQRYRHFRESHRSLTAYQVINLYKIYLLYHFANYYDELLYCDFDVVPNSEHSMFEAFDFSKGVCVRSQTPSDPSLPAGSDRDPIKKYHLTQQLLRREHIRRDHEVTNTGIIGISAADLLALDFFGDDFDDLVNACGKLGFSVNNEALFAYRLCANELSVQWLPDVWHHIYDSRSVGQLNSDAYMIHVINKRFDDVWAASSIPCS